MALPSATSKVSYTGNGSTTAFAFPYLFLAGADLVVTVNGTTKTLGVDYTVNGEGDPSGGTVNMTVAPANLAAVVIARTVALTQPTSFRNQGAFLPSLHENALDRATMAIQQLERRIADLENEGIGFTDCSGTPGNCTINTRSGRIKLDGSGFCTVTNALVTANSRVLAITHDRTVFVSATPVSGSVLFEGVGGSGIVVDFVVFN